MITPPLKARSRRRGFWLVFWSSIFLLPVYTCYAQISESQSKVIALEAGKPIYCDINEMESQTYEIALRKGDLMTVLIKQPGRESPVKLLEPTGKQIIELEPEYGKEGRKVISYVAQMDGHHHLILQPPSKGAPVGPYKIELVELRAATENDLALQEARNLGAEFLQLFRAGKYDDALSSAERSLEIRTKILGENNYIVAASLTRLAICYSVKADFARVEPLYRKALKIWEKILEPEHYRFGEIYNNLGAFYYNTGDYERAETFFRRGLEIREKALGPEHTDVAASLNNLAGTFLEREMYDQAEPLYRRAIAIREKISGPENPMLVYPLSNLADCYSLMGDYDKAEPLYQRTIAILEKKADPYHPQFAYPLEGLARIYYLKGDYEGATARYLRALEIREQALGLNHPEVAGTLTKMAALYAAKGDVKNALKYQARANEISEHNLALHVVIGSERQKLAYLAMQSKQTDRTISLHLQYAPGDPSACSLAVASILQRKGRVLDAMSDSFASMHRRSNPEDRVLLDRLKDTIAQLATLVISGPQKISPADHQKQITELEERKEKLEAEISRNSAEFQSQTQPITVTAVQSAIPPEAALIEFAFYRPFDARARGNEREYGKPRYAAYIIRHQGDVEGFELGETAEIDALISRFREALRDPLKKDVKDWARAVDEK
ncbi:MAG: tetratricopeptide repeat protein, partial [Blastocatellia bacterium]|nr:tetratricopeptide repeat protein [Blastocatellia bacterium]